VNLELIKGFELGADVYWWHYQVFQFQNTVFDKPLFGMTGASSPTNYGNSWNYCIGVLYHPIRELELMAGWQQDFTPIPTQTYSLTNPSTNQDGISMGIRWQVNDHWRVSASYIHNWFSLINVQNSVALPPTNGKGHGANDTFAFDFGYRF
jgi:long-subunit fatty acid transport protein